VLAEAVAATETIVAEAVAAGQTSRFAEPEIDSIGGLTSGSPLRGMLTLGACERASP